MDIHIPNFVSYETLLRAVCCRTIAGRSDDEIHYIVELAERLCRLMREVEEATRMR